LYYPTPTGDGEVLFLYHTVTDASSNTVGIEDVTETVGIQYLFDGLYDEWAVALVDSLALRYTTYPPDYVGIEESAQVSGLPVRTLLGSVLPNPFTREVAVSYQVASRARVRLAVYDVMGRVVCALAAGMSEPGYYTITWNGRDDIGRKLPAGVYFVNLVTDDYQRVEKTILLK
jgi:hypothetical protein